jgi:hypothetical protein
MESHCVGHTNTPCWHISQWVAHSCWWNPRRHVTLQQPPATITGAIFMPPAALCIPESWSLSLSHSLSHALTHSASYSSASRVGTTLLALPPRTDPAPPSFTPSAAAAASCPDGSAAPALIARPSAALTPPVACPLPCPPLFPAAAPGPSACAWSPCAPGPSPGCSGNSTCRTSFKLTPAAADCTKTWRQHRAWQRQRCNAGLGAPLTPPAAHRS